MPVTEHHDLRLYYESVGEGEPLILIRGLGSNADHWYAQVPDLSRHYRVITFDNRAIGRSGDPGGAFTIRDMAADVIGLMDALKIARAHILGLSMGGMIAQELAIAHPQRVKGLVLVVTHCGGERQVKAADEVMETLQRMAVDQSMEARIQAATVFFAARTLSENMPVVEEYATVSMQHPAGGEILQRQMDAIQAHDTYDRLHLITAPTLVLTGAEDILIPPENSKNLADRIPNAECIVIQGGGHQILIEQPEACNRAIIDFLQKVDAAPL
jgi:pimeloyl-ACP methyl ester carboxylesterase